MIVDGKSESGLLLRRIICILLCGEPCKNLLERGLLDAVLLNIHSFPTRLDQAEQEADCFVLSRNTQLVKVSAHFKDLNLRKDSRQVRQKFDATDLHIQELQKGLHSYFSVAVILGLGPQTGSNSIFLELVEDS